MKRQIYLSSSEVRIKLTKNKSRNKKTNANFSKFRKLKSVFAFCLSSIKLYENLSGTVIYIQAENRMATKFLGVAENTPTLFPVQ